MKKIEINTGDRYGQLTVVKEIERSCGDRKFEMLCDCGNTSNVLMSNLRSGHTKSCGCLSVKLATERVLKHGMTGTKEFRCWQNFIDRCTNPDHRYYEKYGKLGMHEPWRSDFQAFLEHIGPQPDSEHRWSVGRIDNDKGYYPGNVRWETGYEQNRNRGKTKANTSGVTGVTWRPPGVKAGNRAVATWYDLDGKQRSKSFYAKHIGKDEAIRLAAEYRAKMIEELNAQGAGYSDKHGK